MKILFVLHRMHPNLREVESVLSSHGHQCVFVVASTGASERASVSNRILVKSCSASPELVERIFEEENPDLVIQRKSDGIFREFWNQARKRNVSRLLYTQDPHLVPLFDALVRPLRVIRLFRDTIKQRVLLGPHLRVTPVKFWGREGRLAFPHSEYLPFPVTIKTSAQVGSKGFPVVLTVAKHGQRRKRVAWLVKALRRSSTPFYMVIVGATPDPNDRRRRRSYDRLVRSINELGNRARYVSVRENLGFEEMEECYSTSDIFVLPSKRELMAISPLEAMSHGLPVLASADGGAASYIRPLGPEHIFRARSYRNFEKRLFRLLQNEELRKESTRKTLTYLRNAHSPEVFVSRLEKLAKR